MSEGAVFRHEQTVITVTWMDGKIEVYRGVSGESEHRLANGVLTID